ncbi:MAG TPA: hypothetical protein DHV62_01450 [Elusimicrobia bacterium]|jgi:hypothetical protein|nr:hypothetical protein [Elusimicrobiota bacterium]
MNKITLAVKIDPILSKKVKEFCSKHGIKQGFFVEKALKEQLTQEELLEDLLDFKRYKSQEKEAISFEEYLRMRRV